MLDTRKRQSLHFVSCILYLAAIFLLNDTAFSAENPKVGSDSQREEYKKLQKEIDTHQEKIEKTKKVEHSILEELDRANRDLNHVQ
jgi:hypothetical protein